MIKKISIIVFAVIILAAGYISLKKLNYLERSVAIFKLESPPRSLEGRDGRDENFRRGFGEGTPRQERINIPDSLRRREDVRGRRVSGRGNYSTENRDYSRRDTVSFAGGGFGEGRRGPDGYGGHGDRRGKTINLNMVGYYLAVFALFTLIAVYLEKGYCLVFKRKNGICEKSDLVI